MSILCLAILVHGNTHIAKDAKQRLYRSYLIIIVAIISEWLAVRLNGTPDWTRPFHLIVKFLDYVFTPAAGIFFVRQILGRTRTDKMTIRILIFNLVLQFLSIFNGWTFYLDEANVYQHGPYWWVYMIIFIVKLIISRRKLLGSAAGRGR